MVIVIAGGSGFMGQHFEAALTRQGYTVTILTRQPRQPNHVLWDGRSPGEWIDILDGAAGIINLSGHSVNCRYNAQNRRRIVESRVNTVNAIQAAILQVRQPPSVFVQASGLGIYGNTGDKFCDEQTTPSSGFLADACVRWEAAFFARDLPHTRRVVLRPGVVLASDGGALQVLARLTRFFLGGAAGDGQQYISWLHIEDMNRIVLRAIKDDTCQGIYNATGPNPVPNAEFMRSLRHALKRPWAPPAPAFAVRIAAFLMRTEPQLALHGRRCIPKRLLEEGFAFKFPALQPALADIFDKSHAN